MSANPSDEGRLGDERKFLHDIATPFTSLQMDLENAIAVLEEGPTQENVETSLRLMGNCLKRIQDSARLITERREVLKRGASQ